MSSVREELEQAERELGSLLRAPAPDGSRARAATDVLRATADRVRSLRLRASAEPTPRQHMQELAGRAELDAEQRRKRKEAKEREPGSRAVRALLAFSDPELVGLTLDSKRLSRADGEELLALVELRKAGELTGRKRKRYEGLIEVLANQSGLFERKRAEASSTAAEADALESARAVCLPASLCTELFEQSPDGLSVLDLGVLAACLFGLESRRGPFVGSRVEDGIELDGAAKWTLLPFVNPEGVVGTGRVAQSVRFLADAGYLELSTEDGRTRIRAGERARIEQADTGKTVT